MAYKLWKECVEIDPTRYDTLSNIASLLCSSGNMESSEETVRSAIISLAAEGTQLELLAKTLIQGLSGVIPIIYNSSSQGPIIREKFVKNLMLLDHEYRNEFRDSLTGVDHEMHDIAARVQSVQLDDPHNSLGCGALGYAYFFLTFSILIFDY